MIQSHRRYTWMLPIKNLIETGRKFAWSRRLACKADRHTGGHCRKKFGQVVVVEPLPLNSVLVGGLGIETDASAIANSE